MINKIIAEMENEIKSLNEDVYCEIEYFTDEYEDGNSIDVRIFGEDGYISEMILNAFLQNKIIKRNWNNDCFTVDIPSSEEIKFGFSGKRFERIFVELFDNVKSDKEIFVQVEC